MSQLKERKITKIILHCSDTPDQGDVFGFEQINKWHKDNGWTDKASGVSCGYHYIIRRSGIIEPGRPETSVGSHCYGHNASSIGICYCGTQEMNVNQTLSFPVTITALL